MRKAAMVVLLSVSGLHGSLGGADSTPFTLARQGGVLISVSVNGAGPFTMLLDTGASHSSVSEELAESLQLPVVATSRVQSPAGERERLITRIDDLVVGPHAASVLPAIIPKAYLAIAGDVSGIVGQDVLAVLRYTIDYRNRRVVWNDRRDPSESGTVAVLPMSFRDGLPVVQLPQSGGMLSLVADSGTGGLVLFERSGQDLPAMTAEAGGVSLQTLHGARLGRHVRVDRFRVGGTTFKDQPAVVLRGTPVYQSDGLLPLHIFGRVTMDGPGGRLILG
jgi:predicted aspartyl protease